MAIHIHLAPRRAGKTKDAERIKTPSRTYPMYEGQNGYGVTLEGKVVAGPLSKQDASWAAQDFRRANPSKTYRIAPYAGAAVTDASGYRGSFTVEVEESSFNKYREGQKVNFKGDNVTVEKKVKSPAKKTTSGEMIPEKFLVTFKTTDAEAEDVREIPGKKLFKSFRGHDIYQCDKGFEVYQRGELVKPGLRNAQAAENWIKERVTRGANDASSPAEVEKEISRHKRLMGVFEKNGKPVPPAMQQKLKFLKEELEKAKANS